MSIRTLRSGAHRRMPWKNGKGETIEIAISPEGATVGSFDWRISTASVPEDGPFSSFPGIDRNLSVLTGEGLVLRVGDEDNTLTQDSAPFAFPGDRPTSVRLIGGTVTDLNVMTRRGGFTAQVQRFRVSGTQDLQAPSPLSLLFCADGTLSLDNARLDALDCAWFDGTVAVSGEATVFLIGIDRA